MDLIGAFFSKIGFSIMVTLLILTFGLVVIQLSEKNDFQQYVNNQIERTGGLTNDTLVLIDNYSEKHYNGRFKMLTTTDKKTYGEIINYQYTLTITPIFFDFQVIKKEFSGSAASKVR